MDTLTLELQKMYGDHHVVEVRRILLELPGVEDVYASSSFRIVEVTYDPGKVNPEQIKASLEEAGYFGELPLPAESGEAAYGRGRRKGNMVVPQGGNLRRAECLRREPCHRWRTDARRRE